MLLLYQQQNTQIDWLCAEMFCLKLYLVLFLIKLNVVIAASLNGGV